MTPDACHAILNRQQWSVGEFQTTDGVWHVYCHKGEQRIVGRGSSQSEAWNAAVMAGESIE